MTRTLLIVATTCGTVGAVIGYHAAAVAWAAATGEARR